MLGIVISATACDNVDWGGLSMHLVPPPAARIGAGSDTAQVSEEDGSFTLPKGPVLYMGRRDSTGVHLVPVAEIAGDSMK
ncbi:MAG: hypothetical protein EXR95_03595, partial [Gemmatimonadetes bacterium]|nr:hypothetical protein [Gemmatimonadota bacterium]